MNEEKQKLIRLVAIKNEKTFSKSKKENYKIGVVKNKKIREKIQDKYNFCTPIYFLTSTEFFLPSQNSKIETSPKLFKKYSSKLLFSTRFISTYMIQIIKRQLMK